MLPVLAGLAWNASGLALPLLADELLATLGQAVVPLCLVLIGVSLAHYGVRGALRGATVLSFLKLVIQPLAVCQHAQAQQGPRERPAVPARGRQGCGRRADR